MCLEVHEVSPVCQVMFLSRFKLLLHMKTAEHPFQLILSKLHPVFVYYKASYTHYMIVR